MAIKLSDANTRDDIAQAVIDAIDAGAGAGTVNIYDDSASRPADPDTAVPGGSVLLATLTFSDPCGTVSAGSGAITFSTITDDASADATGTALWFRVFDSDSNAIMDGDCATSGSDMNFNTTSIVSGKAVGITSWTITVGNA